MPDEKVVGQVTEAPEKSARELVEESLTKPTEKPTAEVEKETAEKSEISEEAKEIASGDTGEEETASTDNASEIEELLKEPAETEEEAKSNVQKRIDKLTFELKSLKAENEKIKAEKNDSAEKAKFTPQQLGKALMKAVETGDESLAADVIGYLRKDIKEELVDMYEGEKTKVQAQQQAIQKEWDETCSSYDKYADPKTPPLYPNSKAELNLRDPNSLLYQVAMAKYWSQKPEDTQKYRVQGGQKLAVLDALTLILNKKAGSSVKDSEKEVLKRRLLKEKRKNSISGSGMSGDEDFIPAKPLTESERLSEAIEERKKYIEERT